MRLRVFFFDGQRASYRVSLAKGFELVDDDDDDDDNPNFASPTSTVF